MLVEPKKAGRSFEDIVNGVDPLPNQIPAAISLNPIVPPKAQEKKEEDKSQYYLDIKNQAELANQRMEEEKKKLEELMQKKKQEEEEKARLAAALEAEKRRKEEEIQREIMRQKQTEDERNMEVQRQQALVKERKEKEMANMRLKVLRSQACKKMFNEIMKQVLEEETKVAVVQNVHKQKVMKRVGLPWLQSARNRISKRRAKVMQLKENWHFNMHLVTHNPYIPSDDTIYKAVPSHAKPDGIKERTKYSLISEAIALEDKDLVSFDILIELFYRVTYSLSSISLQPTMLFGQQKTFLSIYILESEIKCCEFLKQNLMTYYLQSPHGNSSLMYLPLMEIPLSGFNANSVLMENFIERTPFIKLLTSKSV